MSSNLRNLAVLLCALLSGAPAAWAGPVEDGLKDYQDRHYERAAVKFARATGLDPLNVMAHYYLANCLAFMHDKEQAVEEYRLCYILDPKGPVSSYCRDALTAYREPVPSDRDVRMLRDTIYGAARAPQSAYDQTDPTAQRDASARQLVPTSNDPTLNVIRRQVEMEKAKHDTIGNASARSAMEQETREERAVDARADADIERLYYDYRHQSANGRLISLEEVRAREIQIRNAATDEKDRLKRDAGDRVARYRNEAGGKGQALDQVAENLERQMKEKPGKNGVRLLKQGTDLYVRRYASSAGNVAVPEAHPAVVRIYRRPGSSESDPARDETTDMTNNSSASADQSDKPNTVKNSSGGAAPPGADAKIDGENASPQSPGQDADAGKVVRGKVLK